MSDTAERLREELRDQEYSEGYAESFLDSYIATQIKVLREQAGLSQKELADLLGTRQGVISRIENVNYSKWNVSTLKKLARAFHVRLKVSFETYGSLIHEATTFSRDSLKRATREDDPLLNSRLRPASTKRAISTSAQRHRVPLLPMGSALSAMPCNNLTFGQTKPAASAADNAFLPGFKAEAGSAERRAV